MHKIEWFNLGLGFLLLLIPIYIFWYYKTGLVKQSIIAVVRMTIQLLIVGLYLKYLIEFNNTLINILWVLVMMVAANYSIITRSGLRWKFFFIPIFFALLVSIIIVDSFFLGIALRLDNVFEARYFIPITGLIMGNCLRSNIIAMNTFYNGLYRERKRYRYYLACGATRGEALFSFMSQGLKDAFNPIIATMAVIGLIALPGIMTGQIISGSDPTEAIKYQILFMISVLVTSVISVVLTILLANRFTFDEYDRFKIESLKIND